MSFLQPLFLLGLPLIALPVVIHLINQRRYQSVPWGAMMFLIRAGLMTRGYARVRRWLILGSRVLALAGLAFTVGRPLSGGWLGLSVGGRVDSSIVILDRSPSMREAGRGSVVTKLEAGERQLAETLEMLGPTRWVLIDRASEPPRELKSTSELLEVGPSGASSDLPAMLESARGYLEANRSGQTDVWICSDLRENDWDAGSGRWSTIREAFRGSAVRFRLLAYPQIDPANLSIRVSKVRYQASGGQAELLVSIRVVREGMSELRSIVPVQIEIAGARSEVAVEVSGREGELKDHRIPIDQGLARGWGKVSLPLDSNPADNSFWFVFGRPKPRRALIVAEDSEAVRSLVIAASVAPEPSVACSAEVVSPDQLASVDWETLSLLLWQAPLPTGTTRERVRSFVDRGGRVIFFPPPAGSEAEFLGSRWKDWTESSSPIPVDGWRGDQDLLAQTQSGAPLPVGQLQVKRTRPIEGASTPLATLKGGTPILSRVATSRGGVYFCSTTVSPEDSTLGTNGVVLYVLVQRAMTEGSTALEDVRQVSSGESLRGWQRLAGPEGATSVGPSDDPGVLALGDRLIAVNRPAAEDLSAVLPAPKVDALFAGLDFRRVDESADDPGSLVQEIWRICLITMMVAMVVEAALCLPARGVRA